MNISGVLKTEISCFGFPKLFGVSIEGMKEEEYLQRVNEAVFPIIEKIITQVNALPVGGYCSVSISPYKGANELIIINKLLKSYFKIDASPTHIELTPLRVGRASYNCNLEIVPQISIPVETLKDAFPALRPMDLKMGPESYPALNVLQELNANRGQGDLSITAPNSDTSFPAHSFVINGFFPSFDTQNSPLDEATLSHILDYLYTGQAPVVADVDAARTMLKSLGFHKSDTSKEEIIRLYNHYLKAVEATIREDNWIDLLNDSYKFDIAPLNTLCLSKIGSFMGNPDIAKRALKLAQEKQDRNLLEAIASHVLHENKLANQLSIENLVEFARTSIAMQHQECLAVAMQTLRTQLMMHHEIFDSVLPLAQENIENNPSTKELFNVCCYFARQFPELLKSFIEANSLDQVRTLTFAQIKTLAAEAEALICKEVRMTAAKALAEKVTAETYQEVLQFCKQHSIDDKTFKECEEIIVNTNKAALGALKKNATKAETIAYIEDAEKVASWDRVGTGLLNLAKKEWTDWDRFESFRDKVNNHARIKQAFELFDDADSGAED